MGDIGVIHMGLLNIIRRMALREKLSTREIARRTGMSRNTITKYLNAGTIEPQFTTPERQSKLDPFADKLTGWLKTEAGKSRKQRCTLKQLHADLMVLGFDGSYGRIAERWLKYIVVRHCEKAHVDLSLLSATDTIDCRLHIVVNPAPRDATKDPEPIPMSVEQHPLTGSAFAKEMSREGHAFAADRLGPERHGCATA